MFTIIIPTWNNLDFIKCCIDSISKNSTIAHQIVLHINDGSDGTLQWALDNNIAYTHSTHNIGICKAINMASALATQSYIVYMNDDMYCLPNWDAHLQVAIKNITEPYFMLSCTMIEPTDTRNNCVIVKNYGKHPHEFKEQLLLSEFKDLSKQDWNGAFWPPNIVPIALWQQVGGFSEAFSPGMSSDDDFARKCWELGCRMFMGVGASKVYHFQGKSTHRIIKNDGRKQFLQKWGITQSSFRKHYLQLGTTPIRILKNPSKLISIALKIKGALKK